MIFQNQNTIETLQSKKNSPLGLASYVISLVMGFGYLVLVLFGNVLWSLKLERLSINVKNTIAIVHGSLVFGGFLLSTLGLILGFLSLFHKNRRKFFSILGLVFNSLQLIGVIFLVTYLIYND